MNELSKIKLQKTRLKNEKKSDWKSLVPTLTTDYSDQFLIEKY